ncbi:DUF2891 domain-containing protein [Allokutzneria sp. A3M-2-11 16]|uniref:DUF2891 domain-containing protein n=1 Tax=Allokutzneria sp. A3M-2-11 16 TaxID=2962043 RepID=UPI0020B809FA|nr:DUF2891 domain-containing protein [Allokutzneria sp. A3M-2-11 16]MCP3801754.1 DUF2891 domain-containing protein [Allokutzneria sp. A3M-2-11 16]
MASRLDDDTAARLLSVALENVLRDHPVHWTHLISSDEELVPQSALHPVFARSYDWHSCVHQTWLIVRLLRTRPALAEAARAADVLDSLLTVEGCEKEAEFFRGPHGGYWERPYGWAWLFVLDAELRLWASQLGGERAGTWSDALRPLTEVLRTRWLEWAAKARWPVRSGVHSNTAFAAGLVLDSARAVGDTELVDATTVAVLRWYGSDVGYGGFEPNASDFLSPALTEIDVMRRVLPGPAFLDWLSGFLPNLEAPRWSVLREPVPVDDPADPHGSHISGLMLSRASAWRSLAAALPDTHPYRAIAEEAASTHAEDGWRYVFGYGYAADHWLGTFAAYLDIGAL